MVFVSATQSSGKQLGRLVERIVRDLRSVAGDRDPPDKGQIADLVRELKVVIERGDRALVTTLTRRRPPRTSPFS